MGGKITKRFSVMTMLNINKAVERASIQKKCHMVMFPILGTCSQNPFCYILVIFCFESVLVWNK